MDRCYVDGTLCDCHGVCPREELPNQLFDETEDQRAEIQHMWRTAHVLDGD
jgi:hypothetical protein